MDRYTRTTLAVLGLVLLLPAASCGTGETGGPMPVESPTATPTPEEGTRSEPGGNVIPVGPPEVRARALGVAEPRIEAIQADVQKWWEAQGFRGQKSACQSLKIDRAFMGQWMAQTGLPEGPEQELAAQTLLQLTDSFCWRLEAPAG